MLKWTGMRALTPAARLGSGRETGPSLGCRFRPRFLLLLQLFAPLPPLPLSLPPSLPLSLSLSLNRSHVCMYVRIPPSRSFFLSPLWSHTLSIASPSSSPSSATTSSFPCYIMCIYVCMYASEGGKRAGRYGECMESGMKGEIRDERREDSK
jgi:hypothetical protein